MRYVVLLVLKMNASKSNTDISTDFTITTLPNMEIKQGTPENKTVGAVELVSLLQCLGFSLQSFEKEIEADTQTSSPCDDNKDAYILIEIACMKSHIKAILLKKESQEEVLNLQLQNNSLCSPFLSDSVATSKSLLLPTISLDKSEKINGLLLKALNILNEKEINESNEDFTDLFEKSASTEKVKPLETTKNEFKNENSIQRSLLPRITSSPICPLNNSKYVSLDTKNASKLLETFRTAEEILLDAFNFNNRNSVLTKRARRSDLIISPLVIDDNKWRNSKSSPNLSQTDNRCYKETCKNNANKVSTTRNERKLTTPPRRIRFSEERRTDSASPISSRLPPFKKDSTPRSLIYKSQPVKLNLSTQETKTNSLTKSKIPLFNYY